MRTVSKVVAYVVWDGLLLVFIHDEDRDPVTESGLQVPAGTCDAGEDLEAAVIREVFEETGLEVAVDAYLGTATYDMRPYADAHHERRFFALRPTSDEVPERWTHVETSGGSGPAHPFTCFWLPIERGHVLAAGQGALLGALAEHLRAEG